MFFRPFFNFSVGLFLFLSGMLSNVKNYNPKKRIIKILIPYVIWTLIYTLMANLSSLSSFPVDFFKKLFFGNSSDVMYYVGVIRGISCIGWFTYYYLGYLLGNNLLVISKSYKNGLYFLYFLFLFR